MVYKSHAYLTESTNIKKIISYWRRSIDPATISWTMFILGLYRLLKGIRHHLSIFTYRSASNIWVPFCYSRIIKIDNDIYKRVLKHRIFETDIIKSAILYLHSSSVLSEGCQITISRKDRIPQKGKQCIANWYSCINKTF